MDDEHNKHYYYIKCKEYDFVKKKNNSSKRRTIYLIHTMKQNSLRSGKIQQPTCSSDQNEDAI